jgi:subtilisin family serine protease
MEQHQYQQNTLGNLFIFIILCCLVALPTAQNHDELESKIQSQDTSDTPDLQQTTLQKICRYFDVSVGRRICLHPLPLLSQMQQKRNFRQSQHYTYPNVVEESLYIQDDEGIHLKKRYVNAAAMYAEITAPEQALNSVGVQTVTDWIVVTYNQVTPVTQSDVNNSIELIRTESFSNTINSNGPSYFLNVFTGTLNDVEQHLALSGATVYMIIQDHPLAMYSGQRGTKSPKLTQTIIKNTIKPKYQTFNKFKLKPGVTISPSTAFSCRTGSNNGMTAGYFSWGVDSLDETTGSLNSEFCISPGNNGTGIHAYVVDSGVNHHSTFQSRITDDYTFYSSSPLHPHGTHVAGIIGSSVYGVAPASILHNIRVLDENGSGSFSSLLGGMLWISQNGIPGVINLSLGVLNAYSNSIASVIQNLISAGFTIIAAAGNDGTDGCYSFPGNVPGVLTIGAFQMPRAKTSWSNFGTCVEMYAPGHNIISTYGSGSDSTLMSGTSMACPFAAGVSVLYIQNSPTKTPPQIIAAVLADANEGTVSGLTNTDSNRQLHYLAGSSSSSSTSSSTGGPPPSAGDASDPSRENILLRLWVIVLLPAIMILLE